MAALCVSSFCCLIQETTNWTSDRPPCCCRCPVLTGIPVCVWVFLCMCAPLLHMTEFTVIKSGLKQLLLALFSLFRASVGGMYVSVGVCVCVCMRICIPIHVYVLFSEVSVMRTQLNPSNKKRGDKWAHRQIQTEQPPLKKHRNRMC